MHDFNDENIIKKDMTMKELNENLYEKETIEKERVTTNIEIPDEISR